MCRCRDDGLAKWQEVDDVIVPEAERAIVTIAVGTNAIELLDLTGPIMAEYAARCRAQFIAITNPTQNWWGLEKFRLSAIASQFKRTLFLDVDVFVPQSAPNIFAAVPQGHVGIHDDWDHLSDPSFLANDVAELAKTQEIKPLPHRCLNSGVVLCDREHAGLWAPPLHAFRPTHTIEQSWVEQSIRRSAIPVFPLQWRWNCQYWWSDFHDRMQEANFIHLANAEHGERLRLLRYLMQS